MYVSCNTYYYPEYSYSLVYSIIIIVVIITRIMIMVYSIIIIVVIITRIMIIEQTSESE